MREDNPKKPRYQHIVPTSEEMELLHIAIYTHIRNTGIHITKEQILGDAYVGLLIGLHSYRQDKCNNRDSYLVQKVKYHLIDCFRDENKTRSKNYIKFSSLDSIINDDQDTVVSLIPDYSKSSEDTLYEQEILDIVKKSFHDIKRKRKNGFSGDELFLILMLRMENYNMKDIGKAMGCSEGRISQILKDIIWPKFEKIRKSLSEAP